LTTPAISKNSSSVRKENKYADIDEPKKNVPFVMSFEPTGNNYLNYIMVKEQQKMKKSRMQLLSTLDKQRYKFKYYL